MGWVVNATPRPLYPWERGPVPILREAGWGLGPVWTGAENLASTGIRSPDRPARSIRTVSCAMVETSFSIYNDTHFLGRCTKGRSLGWKQVCRWLDNNYHPHKSQQWSAPIPSSYFRQLFDFYYQTIKIPQQRRIYSVTTHSTPKRCAIYYTALSEQIISNEMRPPTDLRTNNKTQVTLQIFLNSKMLLPLHTKRKNLRCPLD
jgi:hypothetical protein